MITLKVGALLNSGCDVIMHGCNCFNTMGAGVAKAIKQRYPEAYEADKNTIKGYYSKLGGYTSAIVEGVTIVNLYTQYNWSPYKKQFKPECLIEAMTKALHEHKEANLIGIPAIGTGLAGGTPKELMEVLTIATEETGIGVTIFFLDKKTLSDFTTALDKV